MATKTRKRTARPRVNPKPPKTISGTSVSLAGDMYSTVNIKGAKPAAVAQKINNALKAGKLIELGGQFIAPSAVVSVKAAKWQDYGLGL